LGVRSKDGERSFKIHETCLGEGRFLDEVVEGVGDAGEFGEGLWWLEEMRLGSGSTPFATVVHRVEVCLLAHDLGDCARCDGLNLSDG
jgi:hypothetical protein